MISPNNGISLEFELDEIGVDQYYTTSVVNKWYPDI